MIPDEDWQRKGASISDKTGRKEFGLTQDEILEAIDVHSLRYRVNATHENPWFRLLVAEVEALVRDKHGDEHLRQVRARSELARIDRELRRLATEVRALEERRARLLPDLRD